MKKIALSNNLSLEARWVVSTLFGCALITLGSYIRVPLIPVPFTLQTLALFILALTQTPKQALSSSLCYLLCATCGLPVLGGAANCFWIMGKSGGYLIAFPIASYVMARVKQSAPPFIALLSGQLIIFFLGWAWLVPFLGGDAAFLKGVAIFIPSAILKALSALAFVKWRNR